MQTSPWRREASPSRFRGKDLFQGLGKTARCPIKNMFNYHLQVTSYV